MSNMPAIEKKQLNIRINIEVDFKLKRYAEATNESRTDAAIGIIERAVRNIQLTSEENDLITKEIKANEQKRKNR